ncbi:MULTISPECIES: hypothetical protein [Ramlibacter]|uniref:Uncharacterized protein n=1 Tax=Ramlibacter aquaticus TaxID=2780094 RepID=A0ABR9SDT1_9BURK|nr:MULTISPECIES: hypothetical protein [Ramlibacter]MBE7940473.1 hypothetical protein [Ramlibacter aquaticus]
MAWAEALFAAACLAAALALQPWRMLAAGGTGVQLLSPLLGTVVILPWMWALPALHSMPLQLQWSGACLVLLMLGWPLAVPALLAVAGVAVAISPLTLREGLDLAVWNGLVPASLALGWGALLRRFTRPHPFVYLLGRCFIGSVLCLFAASLMQHLLGHVLPGVATGLGLVGRWLMAWGDAFVTGMLGAIFVAFRPQWMATWSDARYLES